MFNMKNVLRFAEQDAATYTGKFPVTVKNSNGKVKTADDAEELESFLDQGYELPEQPKKPANSGNNRANNATTPPRAPRAELTKEEADKLRDANLSNSFGLPSWLTDYANEMNDKGKTVRFTAEILKLTEKWSTRTMSFYPATQISGNIKVKGKSKDFKFLILNEESHEAGEEVNLMLIDSEGRTRSGWTCAADNETSEE